ncbi:hypothetical protein GCM10010211_85210 [Streptomyces albospinus]|uniref:YCII-related domain-containing protein n=1 Tax=Streptomyces albospinus TaxID=285515 RepID=A0ABQ2VPC1_9ACTN|nr:YciI family protein [Streptomyces albospinus]GGV05098.1 hypothetical protein GCM10010211_85210 [Streptomyces albospinus]
MSQTPKTSVLAVFATTPHTTQDDIAKVIDAELAHVKKLVDTGVIDRGYHRTDQIGAVLIVNAETTDAAKEILDNLPAVKVGVIEPTSIIPLVPLPLPQD